jgi:hypothetical protein
MIHKHDQSVRRCPVCEQRVGKQVSLICDDCEGNHMERRHELFRSGFPHPSAIETARLIAAKIGGKTDGWTCELYCENQACDVRTIRIFVKEFNYDPPHVRGPFRCVNCGDGLKFNWIRNMKDEREQREQEARREVNEQLWRRLEQRKARERGDEHPELAGWAMSASVLFDHELHDSRTLDQCATCTALICVDCIEHHMVQEKHETFAN